MNEVNEKRDPRSIEELKDAIYEGLNALSPSALATDQLAARAERYREALEVITALDPDWTGRDMESVYGVARAALTDSLAEGEE